MSTARPAVRGAILALLAAALFGVSTPIVQGLSTGQGPFATAALLYLGAAAMGALLRRPARREAAVRRSDLGRIAAMALFGAGLGPALLIWGLQRSSGTSASLMLALEALFTALLARALYRESMDRRVWAAMLLLLAGGIALVLDEGLKTGGAVSIGQGGAQSLGLLAVLGATAAWGIDNTLSRAVAERDPGQVVLGKSVLGAALTVLVGWAAGEHAPAWTVALGLVATGAIGYGLSLRLYLLAQRAFGAARTGSVYAFAPFIGAAAAIALGERSPSVGIAIGAALMLAGVVLHLAESHAHEHAHEAMEHEHAHVHDDGHHDHRHEPMPVGAHSHRHRHEATRHAHAHVPDAHHTHVH